MELSEVVNVQFAFPVVGVVLCAFLVFAFGFKSPGQPPSFDVLDEDDRKTKKSRPRRPGHLDKHKTTADGIEGHTFPSPGKSPSVSKQSPQLQNSVASSGSVAGRSPVGGRQPASLTIVADGNLANKAKPVKTSKKADEPPAEPQQQPTVGSSSFESVRRDEKVVIGEWTTAVSKKDKKNRGKKDEMTRPDKVTVHTENIKASGRSNNSPSRPLVKLNKKTLSDMTTVTVIVPAPSTACMTSTTTTSTTVTQNAVIKVKVIPNVRVVAGSESKEPKEVAGKSTSSGRGKATDDSIGTDAGKITVSTPTASFSVFEGISTPAVDFGSPEILEVERVNVEVEEKWSEVKSAKGSKKSRSAADADDAKYKEIPAHAEGYSTTFGINHVRNSTVITTAPAVARTSHIPHATVARGAPPNDFVTRHSAQPAASKSHTTTAPPPIVKNRLAPWAKMPPVVPASLADPSSPALSTTWPGPEVKTLAAVVSASPKPPSVVQTVPATKPPSVVQTDPATKPPSVVQTDPATKPPSVVQTDPATKVTRPTVSARKDVAELHKTESTVTPATVPPTTKIATTDRIPAPSSPPTVTASADVTASVSDVTDAQIPNSLESLAPEAVVQNGSVSEEPIASPDGEEAVLPSDDESGDWLEAKPQKRKRKSSKKD